MDDESDNHSDHIHAQLPCHHLQVLDGDDLTTNETGDTKRRVPVKIKKLLFKLRLYNAKFGLNLTEIVTDFAVTLQMLNDLRNNSYILVISFIK